MAAPISEGKNKLKSPWPEIKREGPLSLSQFFDNVTFLGLIHSEHKDLKFIRLTLKILQELPYEPVAIFREVLNTRSGYREILKRYFPETFALEFKQRELARKHYYEYLKRTYGNDYPRPYVPPIQYRDVLFNLVGIAPNKPQLASYLKKHTDTQSSFEAAVKKAMGGKTSSSLSENLRKTYEHWFKKDPYSKFTNIEIAPPERRSIFSFLIETKALRDPNLSEPVLQGAGIHLTDQFIVDCVLMYFRDIAKEIPLHISIFNKALACLGLPSPRFLDAPKRNEAIIGDDDYEPLQKYYNALKKYETERRKNRLQQSEIDKLNDAVKKAKVERDKVIDRFERELCNYHII